MRKLLENLGFVLNDAKSQLQPTTRICFLGFIVDSISMELLLPEDKLQKITSACLNLVSKNNPFQVSHDHRSFERNLSNCEQKPEKVRTSTGFEP